MENEDESVKPENTGETGSDQQKNHGFSSHGPGTWDQEEMISSAEKDSKADLPPKTNTNEAQD
jgi:hypothetical protein